MIPINEQIDVVPERSRVCLRPRGALDDDLLEQLEREARDLVERGFAWVCVDLGSVPEAGPRCAAVLAAIDRHARAHGARMTLTVGRGPAALTLMTVGLLGEIAIEPRPEPLYFDWSR